MADKKPIYADDVRREILAADPKLAYIVDRIKPVDAVEVVRCKDCKHYKPRNQSVHWEQKALCCARSAQLKFPADGFCSYGERKDND